jgi:protein transport protein SEC13
MPDACQLDFYGKRLATCSSDKSVKVFDVNADGSYSLVDTLRGHEGPVWEVAWAHPKFGSILASCSYDGRVFVWREGQGAGTGWQRVKEHSLHNASGARCSDMAPTRSERSSVNSIAWAPHELGATLACASSDGKISMVSFKGALVPRIVVACATPAAQTMAPGTHRSSPPTPSASTP